MKKRIRFDREFKQMVVGVSREAIIRVFEKWIL